MGQKLIDITGNKYGRLIVLSFFYMGKRRRSYWKLQCDCGNIVIMRKDNFCYSHSHVKSCGCWHREESSMRPKDKNGKYIKVQK